MLYLGHFSFSQNWPAPDGEPWHALFTCVVEARTIEAAFGKFRRLIRELTKKHDAFDNVREIYLDTCVELHELPPAGLMSFISIRQGENIGGITAALLGAKSAAGTAYQYGEDQSGDRGTMEPFVRLRGARRSAQTKTRAIPPRLSNQTVH